MPLTCWNTLNCLCCDMKNALRGLGYSMTTKKVSGFLQKKTGPYLRTRGAFGDSLVTGWIIIRFRPISSFYKVFPWWYTGKSFELFGLKVSYFTYQNEKSFSWNGSLIFYVNLKILLPCTFVIVELWFWALELFGLIYNKKVFH